MIVFPGRPNEMATPLPSIYVDILRLRGADSGALPTLYTSYKRVLSSSQYAFDLCLR
jgi:hypothetical protein